MTTAHTGRSRWWLWWLLVYWGFILVSVAVAWGCALWSSAKTQTGIVRPKADHPLAQALLRYGTFDTFTYNGMAGFGWERERIVGGTPTVPRKTASLHRVRAGWPMLCMEGLWRTSNGTRVDEEYVARLPDWPGVQPNALSRIPLRPMWGAVLLNALLVGLPFHLAFAFYGTRRIVRRRRGRCMRCGYDLRRAAEQRCSECGTSFYRRLHKARPSKTTPSEVLQ